MLVTTRDPTAAGQTRDTKDTDEARERKRLQNRIAQRKFRERRAAQQQQQQQANAANALTPHSQDLEKLKDVPPELIPWLQKICPNTGLPIPPSHETQSIPALPQEPDDRKTDRSEMHTPEHRSHGSRSCNNCGRPLFHDTSDACVCSFPTPQTTPGMGPHPHFLDSGHSLPGSMLAQGMPNMLEDMTRLENPHFPLRPEGFPVSDFMDVTNDAFMSAPFMMDPLDEISRLASTTAAVANNTNTSTGPPDLLGLTIPAHPSMSLERRGSEPPYLHSASSSTSSLPSVALQAFFSHAHDSGQPLLHLATQKGHCNIIRMLIERNFDINERDANGTTALHIAVSSRQDAALRLLLQHGADIHAKDLEGRSPLFLAVETGFESAVGLFLSR